MSTESNDGESVSNYKPIPSIFLTDVETDSIVENGLPPQESQDDGLAEDEAACLADLDQALSGEQIEASISSDPRGHAVDLSLKLNPLQCESLRVEYLDLDIGANYTFKGVESPCSTLKGSLGNIYKVHMRVTLLDIIPAVMTASHISKSLFI